VPKRKRVQREHTEDWQTIQQYTLWPEQTAYELLRPVVLFGDPAIQRAQETGEPRTSLERKADTFDEQGMVSFFASRPRKQPQETARSLPPDMRQLIVDLRMEMPNISIREIAEICANAGPHLLCHRVYPSPGSIRVYSLSPMALLR
jgi:putative transposase